jgi:predicted RNA methylase
METLSRVSLTETGEDLKGLVYEEVIRNTFDKGENQQFFTPRTIVEFMIKFLGDALSGIVCDPACGTGGFLRFADSHSRDKGANNLSQIIGFEIDERLAWTAGINLSLNGADNFKISLLPEAGSLGEAAEEFFGMIDVIVTNPPFGSDLTDTRALDRLSLGKGKRSRRRGVLFLERCLDLLRPGGVVGIILDDGALNSPTNADVRRLVLERSKVLAVVSLPVTAFMPYASVKSSILFLQKHTGSDRSHLRDGSTFFAEAKVVGKKPNGDPLLRFDKNSGSLELDSDLPRILSVWESLSRGAPSEEGSFLEEIPSLEDPEFAAHGFRLDPAYHHPSRRSAIQTLQNSPYPLQCIAELCTLRNEAVVPARRFKDEEIVYVGLANIEAHTGTFSPEIKAGATIKSTVKRFLPGDILFARMRPELRKVCWIPEASDGGFASAECLVLVPKNDLESEEPRMLPELLGLLLRSDLFYGQVVHLVTGIGRPRLSKTAVLNACIPVPPLRLQYRLLEFHNRSEEVARVLVEESEKALEEAYGVMKQAQKRLIEDLVAKGRSGI